MLYSSALKNRTDRQEESSPAILAGKSCLHQGSLGLKATYNISEHLPVHTTGGVHSTQWPAAPWAHGDPKEDAYQM